MTYEIDTRWNDKADRFGLNSDRNNLVRVKADKSSEFNEGDVIYGYFKIGEEKLEIEIKVIASGESFEGKKWVYGHYNPEKVRGVIFDEFSGCSNSEWFSVIGELKSILSPRNLNFPNHRNLIDEITDEVL